MNSFVLGKLYVFRYTQPRYYLYESPFPKMLMADERFICPDMLVVPLIYAVDKTYENIYVVTENQLAGWIVKRTEGSAVSLYLANVPT